MNVLVTGIDGFVGSHLAEALLSDPEIQVCGTAYGPRQPDNPTLSHSGIRFVPTDVTNFEQVQEAIVSFMPSKVFHLAGQAFVPVSFEDPVSTFKTNVEGTLNVLEAVRRYMKAEGRLCSTLVISSGEVYGGGPEERLPIDETTPLRPGNPYAASKACADLIAQQYRSSFGIDVVVARPFNHLGPRQSELFVGSSLARQIAEMKLGRREQKLLVGNLDPQRDFTDVRDVVHAYIKILEQPRKHPVYNVCSGRAISIRSIVDLLCERSGLKMQIVVDPGRQRRDEIPKITGSFARLHDETGWAPTIPLEKTVADLLEYWETRLRSER
ncbi:MAG: GDP-mannose 4,6-dehydratase [Bacteroidota bacterium]|jgi:GDP-4-dehydro-6-deoxy-D-mannose reductase